MRARRSWMGGCGFFQGQCRWLTDRSLFGSVDNAAVDVYVKMLGSKGKRSFFVLFSLFFAGLFPLSLFQNGLFEAHSAEFKLRLIWSKVSSVVCQTDLHASFSDGIIGLCRNEHFPRTPQLVLLKPDSFF